MSEENKEEGRSVLERLIRIEILLETKFNELSVKVQDHETRIRANESQQGTLWPSTILVALLSAAVTVAAVLGTLLIKN